MCIIATVSMVESTGVYLALSDITKDPINSTRLRNGYRAEGLAVLLGGIFNTFPYTGFSQNVGLVKLSGIKTRLPIYYAAGFLVLLGLLPKFGALAPVSYTHLWIHMSVWPKKSIDRFYGGHIPIRMASMNRLGNLMLA